MSPGVAKKNSFLLKVRLLAVLQLSLLLRRVLRRRVWEEVVVIAVMSQFSKGDINNILIVYISIDFSILKFSNSSNSVRVALFCAWVRWVGNVSLYRNYLQKTRKICWYSALYPESKLGWFTGVVPKTLRISFEDMRAMWWRSKSQYLQMLKLVWIDL